LGTAIGYAHVHGQVPSEVVDAGTTGNTATLFKELLKAHAASPGASYSLVNHNGSLKTPWSHAAKYAVPLLEAYESSRDTELATAFYPDNTSQWLRNQIEDHPSNLTGSLTRTNYGSYSNTQNGLLTHNTVLQPFLALSLLMDYAAEAAKDVCEREAASKRFAKRIDDWWSGVKENAAKYEARLDRECANVGMGRETFQCCMHNCEKGDNSYDRFNICTAICNGKDRLGQIE